MGKSNHQVAIADDDERNAKILAAAFCDCSQTKQMMRDDNKLPPHTEPLPHHQDFHWKKKLRCFRQAYGRDSIVQLGDYGCIAMCSDPGAYPEIQAEELSGELTSEYLLALRPVLESVGLGEGKRDYRYLAIAATDPQKRGKGLFSKMMQHYMGLSVQEFAPLVLEAVNEKMREVYEQMGFELIATKMLAAGKGYSSPIPEEDLGFVCHYLVYWPEKK